MDQIIAHIPRRATSSFSRPRQIIHRSDFFDLLVLGPVFRLIRQGWTCYSSNFHTETTRILKKTAQRLYPAEMEQYALISVRNNIQLIPYSVQLWLVRDTNPLLTPLLELSLLWLMMIGSNNCWDGLIIWSTDQFSDEWLICCMG